MFKLPGLLHADILRHEASAERHRHIVAPPASARMRPPAPLPATPPPQAALLRSL